MAGQRRPCISPLDGLPESTAVPPILISLFALAVLWLVISFNHFLGCDAEAKQEAVAKNWTTMEIILLRQCRATWPLMGDEYDTCVGKIKEMYRKDI